MSSHSLREARAIADEVVLLRAGRVAASGSPTEVFHRSLARVADVSDGIEEFAADLELERLFVDEEGAA